MGKPDLVVDALHDLVNQTLAATIDRCSPFVSIWSGGANARFEQGDNYITVAFGRQKGSSAWTLTTVYIRQMVREPRWWGSVKVKRVVESCVSNPVPITEEVMDAMTRRLDQQNNAAEAARKIKDAQLLRRLVEALKSL